MFDDLFDDILNDTPKENPVVEKNWEDKDVFDTGIVTVSEELPWTTGKQPDIWKT